MCVRASSLATLSVHPANVCLGFSLVLYLQKKIDCPRIVPASLEPMPTGVSRDITISLANATFSKVREFLGRLEGSAEPRLLCGAVWWPGQPKGC